MPALASLRPTLAQRLQALAAGFGAAQAQAPWLGVQVGDQAAVAALAQTGLAGHDARPAVRLLPPIETSPAGGLPMPGLAAWKQLMGRKAQANVLLAAAQYQVMPVDALSVPAAELREAARWHLAPQLDFPAEEASLDLLSLPTLPGNPRQPQFAVVTQKATVRERMAPFSQAGISVAAIDIPELALRNLSVLAAGEHAHGVVHIGLRNTRLALVWRGELCSVRQLELSALQIERTPAHERPALFERLALDIQRTVDSFSRQFAGQELQGLWLCSCLEPENVADALALLLPTRVHVYELARHVQVLGKTPLTHLELGWDYTLAIGAALRTPGLTRAATEVAAQAAAEVSAMAS